MTLHLKFVSPAPVLFGAAPDADSDVLPMLVNMRSVYSIADIGVRVASREHLGGAGAAVLDIVDVGSTRVAPARPCDGDTTPEQDAIFAHRSGAGGNDLVIYFITSTLPVLNGCATHPADAPGALVTDVASQWTLAHECGHVLGLSHIAGEKDDAGVCITPDPTRLMTGCSTDSITGTPTLSADEGTKMRESPYVSTS